MFISSDLKTVGLTKNSEPKQTQKHRFSKGSTMLKRLVKFNSTSSTSYIKCDHRGRWSPSWRRIQPSELPTVAISRRQLRQHHSMRQRLRVGSQMILAGSTSQDSTAWYFLIFSNRSYGWSRQPSESEDVFVSEGLGWAKQAMQLWQFSYFSVRFADWLETMFLISATSVWWNHVWISGTIS